MKAQPDRAIQLLRYRLPLRVDGDAGRSLYVQIGDQPSSDDLMIGVMDSPELAALVAATLNQQRGATWTS